MVATEKPLTSPDTEVEAINPTTATATVPAGSDGERTRTSSHRRRNVLIAGVATVGVGAVAAAIALGGGDDGAAVSTEPIRAQVAEVRDLVETSSLEATMRFAEVSTVAAGGDGVLTELPAEGSTLERNDIAYELSGEPVPVIFGEIPLYRQLSVGVEGGDVLLLEQHLASMDFHLAGDTVDNEELDDGFVVDGVFDDATGRAVERWQADLGVTVNGVVQPTDVLVIDGPSLVSSVSVDLGDRVATGSPLFDLRTTSTESTVHAEHSGEIDTMASGTVSSGEVLYAVDETPIVVLVTNEVIDRTLSLGVADGSDVEAVEQMLFDAGYDADGDLEVDETFDDDTDEAIRDWQDDLSDEFDGVVVDGAIDPGDLFVVETDLDLGSIQAPDRELTATGSVLWANSSSDVTRIVETAVDVADQGAVIEGESVDVEFPDGSVASATVVDVADSSSLDPANPATDPTLAVELSLADVPDAYADFGELDVEVLIVDRRADAVVTVPVSALISTGDSYAVEIVVGSSTQFVEVSPGMFADGFVEVTGIDAGTAVVVSS